jgi:hypothetical protein
MMKKYLVGLTKAIFARTASILPWSGTASQQNATPAGESSGRNKEGASKKSVDKCRAAESDSNRTDSVEIKSRSRVIRVLETPMPRQASALVP